MCLPLNPKLEFCCVIPRALIHGKTDFTSNITLRSFLSLCIWVSFIKRRVWARFSQSPCLTLRLYLLLNVGKRLGQGDRELIRITPVLYSLWVHKDVFINAFEKWCLSVTSVRAIADLWHIKDRDISDQTDFSASFSETPRGDRKSPDLMLHNLGFECNSTTYNQKVTLGNLR